MSSQAPVFAAAGAIDRSGRFVISFTPPATSVVDMYVQVNDVCGTDAISQRVPRPPNPRATSMLFADDVGNFEVDWEPPDASLAIVDSTYQKGYQQLARTLADLLAASQFRANINLKRESADGTGKDYTPAQRLLIPWKAPREGLLTRLLEDIQDEIVATKEQSKTKITIEILRRLALVDIKALETGNGLNRLLAIIQRATITHFYDENMMKEPAHDMAAACVILFLAAAVDKNGVAPNISFDSYDRPCHNGTGKRTFSRIFISLAK